MISDIKKHHNFKNVVNYNFRKIDKGVGELLDKNIPGNKAYDFTNQFELVRKLRPNLKNAAYHVSLAISPNEELSKAEFTEIGKRYLDEMGFNDNQYLIVLHKDTDHPHIHLIANRVKLNGQVVSDKHDYYRSQSFLRVIEADYNLTVIKSSYETSERTPKLAELNFYNRTGKFSDVTLLEQVCSKALKEKRSLKEYIKEVELYGGSVYFNIRDNKVLGVSYSSGKIQIKGKKLGHQFKWSELSKHYNYDSSQIQTISEANSRSIQRSYERKEGREKAKLTPNFESIIHRDQNGNKKIAGDKSKDRLSNTPSGTETSSTESKIRGTNISNSRADKQEAFGGGASQQIQSNNNDTTSSNLPALVPDIGNQVMKMLNDNNYEKEQQLNIQKKKKRRQRL